MHAAERQRFCKLELLFLMEVAKFYGGPVMFIFTCFLTQPDCRNFLSEHCNTIIKLQLCGEGLLLPLLQVDVFQEKQGILQQIILCPSNKPRKACIRPSTDNFAQSLATSTTILQLEVYIVYVVQKISWILTLAGVSYQFGFVSFPICLQYKISGSSVFFYFFPMKFHIILRKKTDPNFENKFRWAWLRELKSPYGTVLRILTKVLSKKILHRKVPTFFFTF